MRTEKPANLSLVAVADPVFDRSRAEAMPWPEKGVLVEAAETGGQAAEAGVRPGDVLSAYGERELAKAEDLAEAIAAARGAAAGSEVPVRYAREGERRTFAAHPGPLGVRVSTEPPTVAGPRLLAGGPIAVALRQALRGRSLPPLPGTRREVEAIAKAFRAADGNARILALTGVEATEARLFASAPGTRYLHLATHGLADETETASFSALALTMPRVPVPGDDGFLSLVDLLERWRGRLHGTDLVVLSACKSQRGRLVRDEGVYALPWGFCTAGCPSAVASLWEVDDESTATLMAAFYERLLAQGGERKCEALAEARKAVKRANPDPFHWAPFVFLGDPR